MFHSIKQLVFVNLSLYSPILPLAFKHHNGILIISQSHACLIFLIARLPLAVTVLEKTFVVNSILINDFVLAPLPKSESIFHV